MTPRALLCICSLAMGLALGCSAGGDTDRRIDSSSHWLKTCASSTDCGDLFCYCGFCTTACSDDNTCSRGACVTTDQIGACEAVGERAGGVCVVECSAASECESGEACVAGACVQSGDPGDPTDAGLDTGSTDTGGPDTSSTDAGADVPSDAVADAPTDAVGPLGGFVACDPSACVTDAAEPRWNCPDGSEGGTVCGHFGDGVCEWTERTCPQEVVGCYVNADCAADQTCNASDMCVQDPECPFCDVCFGWCVDPATACSREACGAAPGPNARCVDSSLAGPLCVRDVDTGDCAWVERSCPDAP